VTSKGNILLLNKSIFLLSTSFYSTKENNGAKGINPGKTENFVV